MTGADLGRRSDDQNHQRITLLATSISYVLVILDTSIVNVALEDMSRDLGTDVSDHESAQEISWEVLDRRDAGPLAYDGN